MFTTVLLAIFNPISKFIWKNICFGFVSHIIGTF